jgi:glycosyltransferase involved in cell wall biosynthesis
MKISIVTITLNAEKYLEHTLNSILGQDYPDIECLVVDGGSTDGTIDIIRRFAQLDNRLKWTSGHDNGISDAMNKGIQLASGDVIAHLHSDDLYHDSGVISSVAASFNANPELLWLTGGALFIDEKGRAFKEIKVRNYSYRKLLRGNCIIHPATFVSKQGFERVGWFNNALKYAMDYDLWLRLGAIATPARHDGPLASFRIHEGSLSTAKAKETFEEEFFVRRSFSRGKPFQNLRYRFEYLFKKYLNRWTVNAMLLSKRMNAGRK